MAAAACPVLPLGEPLQQQQWVGGAEDRAAAPPSLLLLLMLPWVACCALSYLNNAMLRM
jgi:hypothetical protein